MTKELEALEKSKDNLTPNGEIFEYTKEFKTIKQALQRLEAIEEANPSEVLECFRVIKFKTINAGYDYGYKVWDKIEQALIQAETNKKKARAWDIAVKKNVPNEVKVVGNYSPSGHNASRIIDSGGGSSYSDGKSWDSDCDS